MYLMVVMEIRNPKLAAFHSKIVYTRPDAVFLSPIQLEQGPPSSNGGGMGAFEILWSKMSNDLVVI